MFLKIHKSNLEEQKKDPDLKYFYKSNVYIKVIHNNNRNEILFE